MNYIDFYAAGLRALGLPPQASACLNGSVQSPEQTLVSPVWYVFPPAFIPIWFCNASMSYFGVLKHWQSSREICFVQLYVSAGGLMVEIGRNWHQFITHILATAIVSSDGRMERVNKFCSDITFDLLPEIERSVAHYGDDPHSLTCISNFSKNPPLGWLAEQSSYTGGFPIASKPSSWSAACGFEFPDEFDFSAGHIPHWVLADNQSAEFTKAMNRGDFSAAWLSLNSTGWTPSRAKKNLSLIAKDMTGDSAFAYIIDAWSAISDDSSDY